MFHCVMVVSNYLQINTVSTNYLGVLLEDIFSVIAFLIVCLLFFLGDAVFAFVVVVVLPFVFVFLFCLIEVFVLFVFVGVGLIFF